MEGSAVAAIGTDTGGSVRVPAALCGLAGYRASLGRGDWRGGAHLAQSFDTMGWLFRDLEDAPLLGSFLAPPEPVVHARLHSVRHCGRQLPATTASRRLSPVISETMAEMEALGLRATTIDVAWWAESFGDFCAHPGVGSSGIHAGHFEHFEPAIRERLEWGARITSSEIAALRERHAEFRARMDGLFAAHELLLLPAAPVARLAAGADHSHTRKRLLRYTTPFSLAGVPAVTIPCRSGGMQMAAARDADDALLQIAALIGARRKISATN